MTITIAVMDEASFTVSLVPLKVESPLADTIDP
jgi:hypothetical protein